MINYRESLIGKKFGTLTVLSFSHLNKWKQSCWNCKCDCYKDVICLGNSLIRGQTTTCGNKTIHFSQENNKNWKGYGEISLSYFNRFRWGAKRHNKEFDISIEYVWELFLKQNRKCALSGINLQFSKKRVGNDTSASLDRIDSSKGYIKGNVQWVHKDINYMKQDMLDKEFINYCKLITEFNSS